MKISILTPCFNAAKTIERAIHSINVQGFDNVEHIVVDGESTDGTVDILRRYPHIRWISESDRGQSDAMNKAMRMSTGQIFTFLNADDEFLPGAFDDAVKHFRQNPHANMVIGSYEQVKESTRNIVKPKLDAFTVVGNVGDWPGNPVSYFMTPDLQNKVGDFPVENHYSMDYWWMLRAVPYATPVYSEQIYGVFHNYGDNKTSDLSKSKREKQAELRKYLCSAHGVKYIPTWLKGKYWRWIHHRNQANTN